MFRFIAFIIGLGFAAVLLISLIAGISEMISARYILLSVPPLFLIVFQDVRPRLAGFAIAATMALSILLSVADYRLVNAYPRWVMHHIVPLQEQGFHVWKAAESGLRASREGSRGRSASAHGARRSSGRPR